MKHKVHTGVRGLNPQQPYLDRKCTRTKIIEIGEMAPRNRTWTSHRLYFSLLWSILPLRTIALGWLAIGDMRVFIPYPLQVVSDQEKRVVEWILPSRSSHRVLP